LETIRSRCLQLKMVPYTKQEIAQILQQKGIDGKQMAIALADGNAGRGIQIFTDDTFLQMRTELFEQLQHLFEQEKQMYRFEDFLIKNKEHIGALIENMLGIFRDMLLISFGIDVVNSDRRETIEKWQTQISNKGIFIVIENIVTAQRRLDQNVNFSLVVADLVGGSWGAIHA